MTDTQLLLRAAKGDSTAFELLYERHRTAVYRYCWLLSGSVVDAEDVTQECFLALVRKPAAFDGERAQLRTWLIAVARRQWLLHARRGRGSSVRNFEESEEFAVPAGFEEELLRMERAEAVRRALNALPPPQREAVYLFEFEGLKMQEIADVLEIEVNAVKARLFRGRDNLKQLLGPFRQAAR
jgi:RNA polymerase sigma-70 factor (ECF subfamily)